VVRAGSWWWYARAVGGGARGQLVVVRAGSWWWCAQIDGLSKDVAQVPGHSANVEARGLGSGSFAIRPQLSSVHRPRYRDRVEEARVRRWREDHDVEWIRFAEGNAPQKKATTIIPTLLREITYQRSVSVECPEPPSPRAQVVQQPSTRLEEVGGA
jgi:hypothetical protein